MLNYNVVSFRIGFVLKIFEDLHIMSQVCPEDEITERMGIRARLI